MKISHVLIEYIFKEYFKDVRQSYEGRIKRRSFRVDMIGKCTSYVTYREYFGFSKNE